MWQFPGPKNKEASNLSEFFPDQLVAAFSNRLCGNMSIDRPDPKEPLTNRKNFLEPLKIDCRSLVCAKQAHSSNIKMAGYLQKGSGALEYQTGLADTDAIITGQKNLPLAIFTADCLPVFLFDPVTGSIGLVHAGWRGTHGNLAQKTVEVMHAEFNSRPEDIQAFFGPAIRSCCYEVGKDLKNKFSLGLSRRGGKLFLDLALINRRQLISCKVKEQNIRDCAVCTSCRNEEYFSFRKEGPSCGRIMSVMMLK
jgi:polyphenol oxidase